MQKFLLLAVFAVMPALLSQAFAQSTSAGSGTWAPAVKASGLLNTAVTPAQAKRKTAETNRMVRRDTAPEPRR